MTNLRKILALALAVMVLISTIPVTAGADDSCTTPDKCQEGHISDCPAYVPQCSNAGCQGDNHVPGCPLYIAPKEPEAASETCTTENCTYAYQHEGIHSFQCTNSEHCTLTQDHEAACPVGTAQVQAKLDSMILDLPTPETVALMDDTQRQAFHENQLKPIYDLAQEKGIDISGDLTLAAINETLNPTVQIPEEPDAEPDPEPQTDPAQAWYNEGTFVIDNLDELKYFAQLVNGGTNFGGKTVTLNADIDLNNEEWTPIGGTNAFEGTFDGGGHTISNLYINKPDTDRIGLFGKAQNAAIKNLTLRNVNVTGNRYTGAMVGEFYTGTASNCHVTGSIQVVGYRWVGGLAGHGYVSIHNCSVIAATEAKGLVKADPDQFNAGGIIGFNGEGSKVIEGCTVQNMTIDSGDSGVGGIAGNAHHGNIIRNNTVSNVSIVADYPDGGTNLGLIAGQNLGTANAVTKVINNTVINSTATNGGVAYTNHVGTSANTIVGTGVSFDASGKVTAGTMEVMVPASLLPGGYVCAAKDGKFTVAKGMTLGGEDKTYDDILSDAAGTSTVAVPAAPTTQNQVPADLFIKVGTDSDTIAVELPVTVNSAEASVKFDNTAVSAIAEQVTAGDTVSLKVEDVTAETADAPESAKVYEITLTNGQGERVYTQDAPGGTATVVLPLPDGAGDDWKVYYYNGKGGKTDMHATFTGSTAAFTTSHFSTYALEPASTESFKASIGTAMYGTLQAAIQAAGSGETVKLLENISETKIHIADGKNVVIDLNKKTVTGDFWVNGTAYIKNGNILNTSYVSCIETNTIEAADGSQDNSFTPVLTLEDVTATSDRHAIRVDGGTVTIKNGTYKTTAKSGTRHAVSISSGANVTIEDGTFLGYGADSSENGDGGTSVSVRGDGSVLNIKGGEFKNENGKFNIGAWGGTLNISGGIFHKTTDTLNSGGSNGTSETGITGGYFEDKPDALLLRDDKAAIKIKTGTYAGWYEIDDVAAKIGQEPYASLSDALAEAEAGATVTLVASVTEDVEITKNVTLALADHTLTGTVTVAAGKTLNLTGTGTGSGTVLVTADPITQITRPKDALPQIGIPQGYSWYPEGENSELLVKQAERTITGFTGDVTVSYGTGTYTRAAALSATSAGITDVITYTSSHPGVAEVDSTGKVIFAEDLSFEDVAYYEVIISAKGEKNKAFKETPTVSYKLTITDGILAVTASGYTGVYDGQNHQIRISVKDAAGANVAAPYILYAAAADGTYSTTHPECKTVGTHTVYYKVYESKAAADAGEKEISGSAAVVITKAIIQSAQVSFAKPLVVKTTQNSAFTNTMTYPSYAAVTYSSSDSDVATVASDGTVTIRGVGTAVIRATIADNGNHSAASASYELTVVRDEKYAVASSVPDGYILVSTLGSSTAFDKVSGSKIIYDVKLVDLATGEEDHTQKVTFLLPYPSGTKRDTHGFAVLHPEGGKLADRLVSTEANGLKVTSTTSPFAVVYHKHNFVRGYDKTHHWHECNVSGCEEVKNYEKHDFTRWVTEKEATKNSNGVEVRGCKTCGYEQSRKFSWYTSPFTGDRIGYTVGIMAVSGVLLAVVIGTAVARKRKKNKALIFKR